MSLTIHHEVTGQLKAGMVVTCQLGNPFDSYWTPAGPVLLLHSNVCFFGSTQFTGIYRVGNEYHVAMMVTIHNNRDAHVNDSGLDVGITYCTMSRKVDMEAQSCRFMSVEENKTLKQALRIHREQVAALPETVRYVKLEPMAV